MTRVLSLIVIIATLGIPAWSQNTDFAREQLSPKGQAAYDRLSSACIFRIGPVGYGARTPPEELALYDLLEEERAIEALKSLVTAGSYEGGLYGLVGLSLRNNGDFNRAIDIYKARKEARPTPNKTSVECQISDTEEYVATQSGCIMQSELRTKVVTNIQSGRYDRWIASKYKPRS